MKLNENISYHISNRKFKKALQYALKYAVLSLPWTVNRMHYKSDKIGLEKRLLNIVLGKIPEYLLWDFFQQNGVKVISRAGETEYWEKDKFDYLIELSGRLEEWDIKSLTIDFSRIMKNDWMKLPALIPDRHRNDQWSKRFKLYSEKAICKRYLFVYLRKPGIKITLTEEQVSAFNNISNNRKYYKNQPEYILRKIGGVSTNCPEKDQCMVISACAGKDEFNQFQKIAKDSLFCGDLIKTRIDNRGIEVGRLPSFKHVVGLNEEL